ncbi:MAG TPA: hypothetical protein VFH49_14805 [Aquabacterium sp.]|nr:hypothetical protein [Aquabacterium sp.]
MRADPGAVDEGGGVTLPLNYSEHGYIALDGLIGATMQPYMVRLSEPVEPDAMRAVLRELITAYPRLRGVADPGWHMYRLRILPDDTITDQLFEAAWCVDAHLDAADGAAMEALQTRMVNEVVPLERGLLCRFRYVPHAQTPALFLSVHHLLADGRTMIRLLTEVLHRLNGGPAMTVQSLEAPSMLHAVRPARWWQWPRQMWRSRQHARDLAAQLKPLHVQRKASPWRTLPTYHLVKHHTLPVSASALRAKARELGVSLNGFITLCLMETYLAQAPDDPAAAAVIRTAIDLRRFYPKEVATGPMWGNHVASFLIIESGRKTLQERAASIKAQVDEAMRRFEQREAFWMYLFYEITPWLGRTAVTRILRNVRAKGYVPQSCHATNIGNAASIMPADARVRLIEFVPAVATLDMLHVVVELDDRITMPLMWERCEASVEEMEEYLQRLNATFLRLAS